MCCPLVVFFFFFKQKTAYEMRISDWSSDVCSSDLAIEIGEGGADAEPGRGRRHRVEFNTLDLRVRTGEHEIERLAEFEHLKVAVIDIEGVDVEAELIVEPRGLGAEVEAVEPLGLDEERRLRGILRLAGVGARLVAAIVTQIEALAGLGLDRPDRATRSEERRVGKECDSPCRTR